MSGDLTSAIRFYRDNPVEFCRKVLGYEPDPWQIDLLNAVRDGNRRLAVKSGHGVGKTRAVASLAWWFAFCYFPQKVVMTAPAASQLEGALWPELRALGKSSDILAALFEMKSERVVLRGAPDESYIERRTSRAEQPEAMAGVHAAHVLLIGDEASGIPEGVYESAGGSMAGDHRVMVLTGNPVRSTGYFYECFNRMAPLWWTKTVSCVDSPRVPDSYVQQKLLEYGEESNAYRIRVLGEFPRGDDDTVVPMALMMEATQRDIQVSPTVPVVWGLDVARFGSDRSALAKRQGGRLLEPVMKWSGLDLMQLVGMVMREWETAHPRPAEILVDSIGMGSGVVDRLRELGLPVRGINVSEVASLEPTYHRLKDELWFKAREWFEERACVIPAQDELLTELATPRYSFTSSGKRKVEAKSEIKKRTRGSSPDLADAFVLTFASAAGTALHGYSMGGAWNKPLKRGLRVV
jgi:hypothetical protein